MSNKVASDPEVPAQKPKNPASDEPEQESWGRHLEFVLSCIGYCVGLGNVWRFPYLAYQNGGGVFFIPYFLMLFLCGIPLFYTELAMGQFSGLGTLGVWKAAPAFKGIGYGMCLVTFMVIIYYNVVIAWSVHYLFSGFQKVLPWTKCDEWWNTATTKGQCAISKAVAEDQLDCRADNTLDYDRLFWKFNATVRAEWEPVLSGKYTMDEPGSVLGDLVGSNLFAWVLVFLCLFKGIQSSGKVVYFTATFPYVVLLILVIFGATLEGAGDGIDFYLRPDLSKLSDASVWSAAATQIFFSLGVSFGGLMVMASYNKFSNNILKDTLIVALGNCFTSVFAGFGVFSFLGHMAFKNCLAVDAVVKSGPGLAFIAYPEAMGLIGGSGPFISFLFFVMLITLGLDSQFAMVDVGIAGFFDEFPQFKKGWKKTMTVGIYCLIGFLLGFPLMTQAGLHWFNLINDYSAYHGLLFLALFFTITVHYVYGFVTEKFRFLSNIKEMNVYFYANWYALTPIMILFIIGMAFAGYKTIGQAYGDEEVYPAWTNNLGLKLKYFIFTFSI
ncbi:unnamed protein product [Oikopleura dioica]|uniref:Transporter n=1 Tax=Oikopleura dioica TaxID=34765 RepID=E4X5W6_OIKDI|nr:unnamed protein product [Oikopleura dioica]